jgi:ethanolamine-phosphate cytidylyltransferase
MVAGCKFVDEVVPGCPYVMNEAYVNYVIQKFKIDYVVHGDDPCIVDGKDVYEAAKKAGKYQSIPRTEGVSTTDIVGRMLVMTKDHHHATSGSANASTTGQRDDSTWLCAKSKFLTTRYIIHAFYSLVLEPMLLQHPRYLVLFLAFPVECYVCLVQV